MSDDLQIKAFYYFYRIRAVILNILLKLIARRLDSKYLVLSLRENIGQIAVDLSDEGITQQLFLSKIREQENVTAFRELLTDNQFDLILDVGANIGFFALLEAKSKASKIILIEPVGRNFRLLKMNMLLNEIEDKVIAHKMGIGKEDGYSDIYIPSKGNWSSFVKPDRFKEKYVEERVEMVTLNSLYERMNISQYENVLVRCDIEGYEYDLLEGNMDYFRKLKNSWFVLEFHGQILKEEKGRKFIEMAYETGFKIKHVVLHRPHAFTIYSGALEKRIISLYEAKIQSALGKNVINSEKDFFDKYLRGEFLTSRTSHLYMYKE